MEEECGSGSMVRLVRCPKCENLLPELLHYSVYQCGGCGAVLRGKQSNSVSEKRQLEETDNENGERAELSAVSSSAIEKESDELEVDRRKGKIVHEKVPNLTHCSSSRREKSAMLRDCDQIRGRRLDWKHGMSSESQETRHSSGPIRSRAVGFHRSGSITENGRFGISPYSNEGPSSSQSTSFNKFGDHITNHGSLHEHPRVQDVEDDRVELLKKLDDLRTRISRSCNIAENPNRRLNEPYPWPHQPPHHHYPPPTYHNLFHGYNQHDTLQNRPSCSCSQCCNINWQQIPLKVLPFSSFPGPRQLPRHHFGSLDLGNDSFGTRYPRRRVVLSHGGERVSRPVSGGAPFISCCNCFELLKIPKKLTLLDNINPKTIKCAVCSTLISLRLEDNKLVVTASSPIIRQKVNKRKSNRSAQDSLDYDKYGYFVQLTEPEPEPYLPTSGAEKSEEQSPDSVIDKPFSHIPVSESQSDELTKSQRSSQEKVIVDHNNKTSLKDALVATEIDVPLTEYLSDDVSKEDDQMKCKKLGNESFFAGLIKKRIKDFSRSSNGVEKGRSDVFVNGQILTERAVRKAEKLAGPIHPGEYWYDSFAGFWGVINQPCLGIIPPFIEELNYPMPKNCAAGNTRVFVNGRELNQKDLDLLAGRGLPTTKDRSYIIEISGKVVDEDTGEELDALGKLAPTVERVKHGFGMKVPKLVK